MGLCSPIAILTAFRLAALAIRLIGEYLSVSRRVPGNKNAPKIRGK